MAINSGYFYVIELCMISFFQTSCPFYNGPILLSEKKGSIFSLSPSALGPTVHTDYGTSFMHSLIYSQ